MGKQIFSLEKTEKKTEMTAARRHRAVADNTETAADESQQEWCVIAPGATECYFGLAGEPNAAYHAVREALRLSGLDATDHGTERWNPLGGIVRPGDTVVLKPNFVRDYRESSPDDADCVITHGAVLRAIADYVAIALRGSGHINSGIKVVNRVLFGNLCQIHIIPVFRVGSSLGRSVNIICRVKCIVPSLAGVSQFIVAGGRDRVDGVLIHRVLGKAVGDPIVILE